MAEEPIGPSQVGSISRLDQISGKPETIDVSLVDAFRATLVASAWRSSSTTSVGDAVVDFNWSAIGQFWPDRRLVCAEWRGSPVAMMQLEEDYLPFRTRPQDRRAIYVSFMEVAPDMRLSSQSRRFLGLGIAMLKSAVLRSQQLGWHGRVGLHSIAEAREFCAKVGFQVAYDPGENEFWETYLELAPQDAENFLSRPREG